MPNRVVSESQLAEKCRKCPKVKTCDHKRLEAVAMIVPDPDKMNMDNSYAIPVTADILEPMAVKYDYRDIKIAEGMTVTIDLEEVGKKLKEDLMDSIRGSTLGFHNLERRL